MAFKIFISYSGSEQEQAVVWRLQTLAVAQGIEVYVPKRAGQPLRLVERVAINDADIVLAIVTSKTDKAVENELTYALERQRVIVPIVQEGIRLPPLFHKFRVFRFSALTQPGTLETQIVQYLQDQKLSKDRLQLAGAVIAVGLGLLLLSSLAKD